jgi:hypothetical protein
MEYYDLKKHWRKIRPHPDHPEVQKVLVRDFNRSHGGDGVRSSTFNRLGWRTTPLRFQLPGYGHLFPGVLRPRLQGGISSGQITDHPFGRTFYCLLDLISMIRSSEGIRLPNRASRNVRFTPKSGHPERRTRCPLSANSGRSGLRFLRKGLLAVKH